MVSLGGTSVSGSDRSSFSDELSDDYYGEGSDGDDSNQLERSYGEYPPLQAIDSVSRL